MGRCLSPCDGAAERDDYDQLVAELRQAMVNDPAPVSVTLSARMEACAEGERYEEAAAHRDRLAAFIRHTARAQRLSSLTRCPQIIGARRSESGQWEVHVVRHGRLAAAGVIPARADAHQYVRDLLLTAETVLPPHTMATPGEEGALVATWLEQPGVRLVDVDGEWTSPVRGAARLLDQIDVVQQARTAVTPPDERRLARPVHRPVR